MSCELWTVKDGYFVSASPSAHSVEKSPKNGYALYWKNNMETVSVSFMFNSTLNLNNNPIMRMAPCSQEKGCYASRLCRHQLPRSHLMLLLLLLLLFSIIIIIIILMHCLLTFQVSKCKETNIHYRVWFFSLLCSNLTTWSGGNGSCYFYWETKFQFSYCFWSL